MSDFYIPQNKLVTHKIQSSTQGLNIQLENVPKIIKPLVQEWALEAYVISFKLETDQDLIDFDQ